jgi:hypothetical protein
VRKGEIFATDERPPRLHIVGIGVNTYTGPKLKSLRLAVTDVTELASALSAIAKAGGYDVPEPILLPEDKAKKENIARSFKDLAALDTSSRMGSSSCLPATACRTASATITSPLVRTLATAATSPPKG